MVRSFSHVGVRISRAHIKEKRKEKVHERKKRGRRFTNLEEMQPKTLSPPRYQVMSLKERIKTIKLFYSRRKRRVADESAPCYATRSAGMRVYEQCRRRPAIRIPRLIMRDLWSVSDDSASWILPLARWTPYAAKAREIPASNYGRVADARRSEYTRARACARSHSLPSRAISSLSTAINRPRRDIFIYALASNPPCTVWRLHHASLSLSRSLFRRYVNRNQLPRFLSSAAAYQAARDACVDRCWERFESSCIRRPLASPRLLRCSNDVLFSKAPSKALTLTRE